MKKHLSIYCMYVANVALAAKVHKSVFSFEGGGIIDSLKSLFFLKAAGPWEEVKYVGFFFHLGSSITDP